MVVIIVLAKMACVRIIFFLDMIEVVGASQTEVPLITRRIFVKEIVVNGQLTLAALTQFLRICLLA